MDSSRKQDKNLARLAQVSIFQGLDQPGLAELMQRSRVRRVEKDGYFFFQGDPADYLYVLVSGRAKLCQMTADGQQVIMKIVGPWEMIGGLAIVGEDVYPVCCLAAEDCTALSWSTADLAEMLKRNPTLALNAARWMGGHVKEIQELFIQMATLRVEQRVARTLLRLIAQTGQKEPGGVQLNLALTRQDLAEMSGTTLFTVSRILSQWERDGIIDAGRGRVIVKYPHGLVAIAEDLKRKE